ncbi:amidase [Kosakonia radicincitans DSM 16656]|uniref:amidase n=1 Tax=Kosakonia radicincitans TaxID=283686 RepID=UPI000272EAF8|nr:amidase [Kosakonia radicincitans]ARD60910.1 amidase [Kosakonia radicincitans DSM 16656]
MKTVMNWQEWAAHDATALAERVQQGEISATELAQQAQAAVSLINPQIGSVVELFDDAIAAPQTDGTRLDGPFRGVPFLMKDLGPGVKNRLQEQGSKFMQGNRPAEDAFLTTQIRAAGLNIMGRTTTPEFGVCGSVENPEVYVTRNPWDPAYTTFGSSAGSCASVAAGIVPLAHATDGGGSIRIPAGSHGLIGLKSSRGVLSIAPALSDITGFVSTQGCVSRSVRDTARFIDSCRGGAPGEFMPYWESKQPYSEMIKHDPAPLRIAVSHEWGNYRSDAHFVSELERTVRLLEELGHHVEWVTPQVDFAQAFEAQTTCYISNFAQFIQRLLEKKGLSSPPEDLVEPINIRLWQKGIDMSYSERWKMQDAFNTVSRDLGRFFQQWDMILTPTFSKPTPLMGEKKYLTLSDNPDVMDWFYNLWDIFSYTPLASLTGTAGISIPLAWQQSGIPLGMHFQTRQANDGQLLQLAAQIERALGGSFIRNNVPQVHVSR